MMVAIIILMALLSFQFVASIEKECGGLCMMFALEIILFAFIMNGVRTVIANGLEKEAHGKVIDEKWKNWNEKN